MGKVVRFNRVQMIINSGNLFSYLNDYITTEANIYFKMRIMPIFRVGSSVFRGHEKGGE